ncbi:transglutaminase-like domain-containing protein [Polaribacter sp. Hel1_85]|uniref:transglutaminase-like domain-containing protein n=1 Tax=Polaribacter sp. Hel1_85 TaxID=1250005 RepID=UPI00052E2A63|nr:transglutaminase-like domain-containing protein [Polaribacter sp. Hel1_85]KGL62698.1 transglutaminase domain protein-containing protein [Polaribacter sp. Hel1_85]
MEKHIKSKIYKSSLIAFFLLVITSLNAQYSTEFLKYRKLHPEAARIRLQQETIITIEATKEGLEINQEFIEEDLYLNEAATYNSKNTLNFSAFFELNEVKASTLSFENNVYVEKEVEKFTKKDDLNSSFYDDTKSLNYVYPNLKKGSKSKLKYSQKIKNPRFLMPFYFGEYYPIKKNKVTIIADKDVNLEFRKFNISDDNIQFTKEEKRKKTIYTWQLDNQAEYDYEANTPNYKTILPHIVPIITSYKINKKTKKVLGKVSDLYGWYYSLVENVNVEPANKELVTLVDKITADKKTELEKVKAIYYWTQKNIKYIAFEYALGGFIPRESNEVFRKKYGDCKDNSSILYRMLEIAGVKGNLTWIGTRSIPYTYEEVPTPVVDNHMILSYENNGRTYYLDATGRYIKFGIPTSFIQGKEALVSYGKEFKIKKVPVIAAKESAVIDSTSIKIENGSVIGTAKTTISGYPKIDVFNDLENENTETKLKQFYNRKFVKGNNKFLVKNFKETNKYHYDNDFIVDYDFEIKNYSKKLGDEIYINLNLNKDLSYYKTDKKRENAIEYDYKRYFSYTTKLEIPKGYKVDYMPETVKVSNDFITSEITYVLEENEVIYNHTIELNFLILSLENQKEVNKLIKKIERNYKEIVVLKKE